MNNKQFNIGIDAAKDGNGDYKSISISISIARNDNELAKSLISKIYDFVITAVNEANDAEVKPKKPELPKQWGLEKNKKYWYINKCSQLYDTYINNLNQSDDVNQNCLPSKESALNVLALCKLLAMREQYVGNWKPDWNNDNQFKYCIISVKGKIQYISYTQISCPLSFPTSELAKEFLNNFESLIEEAGDLI